MNWWNEILRMKIRQIKVGTSIFQKYSTFLTINYYCEYFSKNSSFSFHESVCSWCIRLNLFKMCRKCKSLLIQLFTLTDENQHCLLTFRLWQEFSHFTLPERNAIVRAFVIWLYLTCKFFSSTKNNDLELFKILNIIVILICYRYVQPSKIETLDRTKNFFTFTIKKKL